MNDINFDELDKAVSSVLATSKKKDTEETVAVKTDKAEAVVEPQPRTDDSVQEKKADSAPAETPSVIPKRRGQFMDMVHPSSDMASKNKPEASQAAPLRRQGPRLAPLSPSIVEADAGAKEEKEESPVLATAPKETQDVSVEATSVQDVASDAPVEKVVHEDWPDPIELGSENGAPEEKEAEVVEPDATIAVEEESPETEPVDEKASAESPFIESIDVEKRPLGSFAETKDTPEAAAVMIDPSDEIVPEAPSVPAEEQADIVAIESDEPHTDDEGRGTAVIVEPEQPSGPPSIAPQYSAAPTAVDSDEHAVFDTQEYHQPITPPEKTGKHRGLLYTLVAILMVGVGAAIGYAVFVLKLI